MLVQFTFDNFRSVRDSVSFSMISGTHNTLNVFEEHSLKLLSSAVIYGANASGKSNVLKAFDFMKSMVLNAQKVFQSTDHLSHDPFRLSTETDCASSSFEIIFIHQGIKYRYGFEADMTTVFSEWLFSTSLKGKESKLFFRDIESKEFYINSNRFKEGKNIKVLPNSLFLWKCDQNGGKISASILEWFKQINYLNVMHPTSYMAYTLSQMNNPEFKSEMIKLLSIADLGIQDVQIEENDGISTEIEKRSSPDELKEILGVKAMHHKYDATNNVIGLEKFDFSSDESEGTKKYFSLSAPFIDTLKNGKILIVDELDASLHPMLTIALISLFNHPQINTKKAQIIFATHDTNLLNQRLFHKSQVWFTEKDKYGCTHLTSLVEYKNVQPSDNIEKHYIQGKYGAIPSSLQHI